MTIEFGGLL